MTLSDPTSVPTRDLSPTPAQSANTITSALAAIAAAAAAAAAAVPNNKEDAGDPSQQHPMLPLVPPQQQSVLRARPSFDLARFWQEEIHTAQTSTPTFKTHTLPLARIKKVMKSDPDVKMISAEVPILFAKACEIFITEISKRAWVHADDSKRRTLLRADVTTGVSKTDMCDFLIDIVPREYTTASNSTSAPSNHEQQLLQQDIPGNDNNNNNNSNVLSMFGSSKPGEHITYYPSLNQVTPEQFQQYQIQLHYAAAAAVAQMSQNHSTENAEDASGSQSSASDG